MGCIPDSQKLRPAQYLPQPDPTIDQEMQESSISAKYQFLKVLGQGGVCKTYLCRDIDNSFYAIQKIVKSSLGKDNCTVLCTHFSVLQKLNHPSIVKFYELYEESQSIYVVMEYCSGSNLFEYMLNFNPLSESESSKIVRMLLQAVQYLREVGIVHCDIKPLNIMFSSNDKDSSIKLIDFNLCKFRKEGYDEHMNGTPQFLAPEILDYRFSNMSDVWAVGITMHIMLSGEYPFWGDTHKILYSKIKEGKLTLNDDVWCNISSEAKDLISKLLEPDMAKRICPQDALAHSWFRNANKMHATVNAKVRENFSHINQQYKLYKAMTKIVTISQWKNAFAKVKEMLRTEDGSHKVYLSEKELICLLQEMNHSATSDEIMRVLVEYNKHSSTRIHAYDKLAQIETFEGQLHSCSEVEIRCFI